MSSRSAPWGTNESVHFSERAHLKLLHVEPGQRLSLQKHQHRAEHWVCLEGEVDALVDDTLRRLMRGDHVRVPMGSWHRLSNPTADVAVVAEVQVGRYSDLGAAERDVERALDDYGRAPERLSA